MAIDEAKTCETCAKKYGCPIKATFYWNIVVCEDHEPDGYNIRHPFDKNGIWGGYVCSADDSTGA